jgi:hypothetical protein
MNDASVVLQVHAEAYVSHHVMYPYYNKTLRGTDNFRHV